MGIFIDDNKMRAHLYTPNTSYVIETLDGELLHSYWGKRIELPEVSPIVPIEEVVSFYPTPNLENKTYSLQTIPREYPDFGRSDYRNPAVRLRLLDGTTITKFVFESFQSIDGKPEIPGLPAVYCEDGDDVQTLIVTLHDEKTGVKLELYYTVNATYDAITRHSRFVNEGSEEVQLTCGLSANVDFYNDNDFDLIHLNGSWGRERELTRLPIGKSTHVVESRRGSSSHQQNPMVMLARPGTDDLRGEVYSMNFVYSGSYKSVIEVNSFNCTRFQMGINDFDFIWQLKPTEEFHTPEVVMVYSDEGFNGMSGIYHRLYRQRLCRGMFRDKERPVLINNWEATYFMFTQEKLEAIADAAGEVGVELFVLDDGWFGVRNSDLSGLGDWFVNEDKLKNGLGGVAKYANNRGLKFGLWFEPEMVSPDSDLYRAHPDWALHAKGHTRSEGRNQLVLDFSREDVQDYIIKVVGDILRSHPIAYVKWDMNRNMTEVHSARYPAEQQGEITHRYMLGLYRVMDVLTSEFTDILFESCSGGGGRFDPGMLYYMPQTWTSDVTDSYERLFIQYGTSMAYPPVTMGAHVSESPNHQVEREATLETRGFTSMMCNLGYELDLSKMTEKDKKEMVRQIEFYKEVRKDLQFGNFYRLLSPYTDNGYNGKGTAFLTESEDRKRYYLFYFRSLNRPNIAMYTLPLVYLSQGEYKAKHISFSESDWVMRDANGYEVEYSKEEMFAAGEGDGNVYDASFLNRFGYTFNPQCYDFDAHLIVFEKTESQS